ncbi:MAG: TetR/AcrR family transcriptional regulator, partial [Dehalococcoidia bacterium]|nr:TetR/AcrR family transcriptional regulator [Dehalococcoidia bacterium]
MPTTAPPRSSRNKRELQRTVRRDAILAAARKVFARKGFDGSTIADIAGEAGVAAGTVYLYYASKIDLFAALNVQLFRGIIEAMEETDAPPELRGGTHARIHAVFQAAERESDLLRLIFLNPDPRTEVARRLRHADEERLRPIASILRTGMEASNVRGGDPMFLARLINGLVL